MLTNNIFFSLWSCICCPCRHIRNPIRSNRNPGNSLIYLLSTKESNITRSNSNLSNSELMTRIIESSNNHDELETHSDHLLIDRSVKSSSYEHSMSQAAEQCNTPRDDSIINRSPTRNKLNFTSNVHRPPECIICLEEFSDDNPVMNTLCACGENRALFHYPCLLLWLENKETCPNCSAQLYYQVCNIRFMKIFSMLTYFFCYINDNNHYYYYPVCRNVILI